MGIYIKKFMKRILSLLLMLLISATIFAQHPKMREVFYQVKLANALNADNEIVLDDKARVDIVTDTFAIEVDFAEKWAESIGQSLYYSIRMDKKPGVLLLVNGNNDEKLIRRLAEVAIKYNITVWIMDYNTDEWRKLDILNKF